MFPDEDGIDPLLLAVNNDNLHIARTLLEHGADPVYTTYSIDEDTGKEVVHEVRLSERAAGSASGGGVVEGMLAEVERMKMPASKPKSKREREIDALGEDDPTRDGLIKDLMLLAVRADDVHTVERLVRKHGDQYASILLSGELPLVFSAVLYDRLAILKVLVGHGADIHTRDRFGCTLLDFSVLSGHTETTGWLLEMGVESVMREAKKEEKPTPLHVAAMYGNRRLVELLLAHRTRWGVNERAAGGMTPLHGMAESVPEKRRAIADGHAKQREGVIIKNHPPSPVESYDANGTVAVLIAAGADWTLKSEWIVHAPCKLMSELTSVYICEQFR